MSPTYSSFWSTSAFFHRPGHRSAHRARTLSGVGDRSRDERGLSRVKSRPRHNDSVGTALNLEHAVDPPRRAGTSERDRRSHVWVQSCHRDTPTTVKVVLATSTKPHFVQLGRNESRLSSPPKGFARFMRKPGNTLPCKCDTAVKGRPRPMVRIT